MWRLPKESADTLEPIAMETPLDIDHSSTFENAREDETRVALGIDARQIDLWEEPRDRSWESRTGRSHGSSLRRLLMRDERIERLRRSPDEQAP